VRVGLVQSLSHPGGNITGLASLVPGNFLSKGIQILGEMVPAVSKIAVVVNPSNADHRFIVAEELPETARKLGVTFPVLEATTVEELDIAFASAAAQHADAIVPLGSELTVHVTRVPRWRRSIVCPRSTSSDCSPPMAVWFHTASI
jgi:putative tryptophan/tyrosine transport system substrate-binding protein